MHTASNRNTTPPGPTAHAVFISYRRADSSRWAELLNKHIAFRFGHDVVFRDVTDIHLGQDFLQVLERELRRCRVFLVLIGPHWVLSAKGERRLEDRKDILRSEVTHALESTGTVIPLLVGGSSLPAPDEVPRPLRPLLRRQAMALRPARWSVDVKALIDELRQLVLPTAKKLSLARAQAEVVDMQDDYFKLLDRDPAQALELARKAHSYLDRALPLYPQDPELKVTRGYLFKNEAMALIGLERSGEARLALHKGQAAFRTMLRERRRDASAWNGLGSVEAVRAGMDRLEGRYREAKRAAHTALGYIDKALAIQPNYSFAQQDRGKVGQLLSELP